MRMMAELLQRGRAPAEIMAVYRPDDAARGPYSPCPCGSGAKFRFCHGAKAPRSPFSGIGASTRRSAASAPTIPEQRQPATERNQLMADKKPNILILWGDDIGIWNISHFSRGMMGYRTPNIDRVAEEGVSFTDYYSQQSCTAGRACFITGQNPIRTGLTKVGMPGATVGLQKEDPTIAELLKPLGYATGQFGKNHLGDRNEYLPTVHGFDEFFGNLYHLNAEEEPELPDYPKDPEFQDGVRSARGHAQLGERHRRATTDPRWGRVGKQKITDTGPLTKKRMETIDEEITDAALAWMEKQAKADQPFFLWYNSTAMHFRTHVAEKNLGKSGQDPYSDRMVVHDEQIGRCSTSSTSSASPTTPSSCTPPTTVRRTTPGRTAPTRRSAARRTPTGRAAGGCRASSAGRARSRPARCSTASSSHIDMFPTLLAAAGNPDVTEQLLDGCTVGGKTFNVHLDGYNMIPYLTGEAKESPRHAVIYFSDDGDVIAVRIGDWKLDLAVQRANQMRQWAEPFVKLRAAVHHEPAPRPVRAGRVQLQHLLGLDGRPRPAALCDAGGGGGADRGLRQVPAAPEAGLVQPGRGVGSSRHPRSLLIRARAQDPASQRA